MTSIVRLVVGLMLAFATPALAQDANGIGEDIFSQGLIAPNLSIPPPANTLPTPKGVPVVTTPPVPLPAGPRHKLVLEARLVEGGDAVPNGLIWRVFGARPARDGKLPLLVETAPGGSTAVELPAGDYYVNAAFGRAGATKHVSIGNADDTESLVLNAGGLKLDSVVGDDRPIPPDQVSFEVQQADESGEFITVVPSAAPGRILRLSAGTYHVVSRYGNINAIVRADIEVKAGKLTEAVMRQSGAEVTLKLVAAEGGEALANTSWTVTTQEGITVNESVGAFPSIILAAGTYTAIAKHQGEIYSRDFTVQPGLAHDIEVRLSDLVEPQTEAPVGPSSVVPPGTDGAPLNATPDSD